MRWSPDIPEGAAVAAVDGSHGEKGAATGVVLFHAGRILLDAAPADADLTSWQAEAAAVIRAAAMALERGVRDLRVLADNIQVAAFVQGHLAALNHHDRNTWFQGALAEARSNGLNITARVVQGHTETRDLPSRMNDLSHQLAGLGHAGIHALEIPLAEGWYDALMSADPRLRPDYTHQRWNALLTRWRTAQFLGIGQATVDALVRAGHLSLGDGGEGIQRRSIARVYEEIQAMRHEGFFSFDPAEPVAGRAMAEISLGWDHRACGMRMEGAARREPNAAEMAAS